MTTHEIVIRRATAEDLQAIVDLSYGLFQEDGGRRDPSINLEWPREHGAEYFAPLIAGEHSACFVAEAAGEVVGYLVGYTSEPSSFRPVKTAELESMFVREAWRGQGTGAQLVRAFVEWANRHGAQSITVTAYYANQRAIAFYQQAGFAPHQLTLKLDTH
jgi:GNAT superfamily N-acetyltransferase